MLVFRAEFSIEDYIFEDWCHDNGIDPEDIDLNIYEFIEDHLGDSPDHVEIL